MYPDYFHTVALLARHHHSHDVSQTMAGLPHPPSWTLWVALAVLALCFLSSMRKTAN